MTAFRNPYPQVFFNQGAYMNTAYPKEVEFLILHNNSDISCEKLPSQRNKGALVGFDEAGMALLTRVPLKPGDMVRVDCGGTTATGIVMWSIASSDQFRIQMRFV